MTGTWSDLRNASGTAASTILSDPLEDDEKHKDVDVDGDGDGDRDVDEEDDCGNHV